MNGMDVNLHLHDELRASVLWAAELSAGRCVASVQVETLTVYFEQVAQIEKLQAVLSEAAERLRALKAPTEAVESVHNCQHPGCIVRAVAQCESGTDCDRWFCADHGSVGGDRPEGEEGMQIDVAYPSQCWAHGGFDADAE